MGTWNVVVITCSSSALADCIEEEVKLLQKRGSIHASIPVLTAEDPAEHIGSGAATVNALLVATEYLSVQKNFSVVNADVLDDARVLILHQGRNCIYSGCAKSLITLPRKWNFDNSQSDDDDVSTNLELLFGFVSKLSKNSPPGVWVCSTDMSLVRIQDTSMDWECYGDVTLFCVQSHASYAADHGCVAVNEEGYVTNIFYHGTPADIDECRLTSGSVLIVSGIVFLTSVVAESLLSLHSISPLESCTYFGMDSGAEPVQVSWYFDVLMSMAVDISEEEFLNGKYGNKYNIKAGYSEERLRRTAAARALVWKKLGKFNMAVGILEDCIHCYWTDQVPAINYASHFFLPEISNGHSSSQGRSSRAQLPTGTTIHPLNSIVQVHGVCEISPSVLIVNSDISVSHIRIRKNCYICGMIVHDFSGFLLDIPEDTAVLYFDCPRGGEDPVIAIFGMRDKLQLPIGDCLSTFKNAPWSAFFRRFGVTEDFIWDHRAEPRNRNLLNAKLFTALPLSVVSTLFLTDNPLEADVSFQWINTPRYSLAELIANVDNGKHMNCVRKIYSKITAHKVKLVLLGNEDRSLLPYFSTSVAEGWSEVLLDILDSILLREINYITLTRTLSAMADLLGVMAGKSGCLRSGPGNNRSWSTAFKYLLNEEIHEGMLELKRERQNWLSKPRSIMRAARHYERAAQILILNCLKTTKQYITFSSSSFPDIGVWVVAQCPARIDLQGGWTDTPPICYEFGGSVVNAAVLIDGKKPISAKAQRKEKINIELIFGAKESPTCLVIERKEDVLDFDQPYAQGALLKAALVCVGIVDTSSDLSLQEELSQSCSSGLVVHAFADLPQGCGMGTSSILAGAVVSVLWSVMGKQFDKSAVLHAVLYIEQLLTTGGGWQDQVGGIMGGTNRGFSNPLLPLHIEVSPINLTAETVQKLSEHLILIYTGKVRLAKNILQNVIRNWYARDAAIVECFQDLKSASMSMERELLNGDLEKIGSLMDQYWRQKKILAPGCEPSKIKLIMDALKPICHGQILVGAGGGGFMCALMKHPNMRGTVEQLLSDCHVSTDVTCHNVSLDFQGLVITLEN